MRASILVLLVALSGCGDPEPVAASHDPLGLARSSHAAARVVRAHVDASLAPAAPRYDQTLAALEQQSAAAAELLGDTYRRLDTHEAFRRWLVVHTAAKLSHPACLALFDAVLAEPRAADDGDLHHGATAEEQGVLRLTALDGIARVAQAGDAEARARLARLTDGPDASLARAARRAYEMEAVR